MKRVFNKVLILISKSQNTTLLKYILITEIYCPAQVIPGIQPCKHSHRYNYNQIYMKFIHKYISALSLILSKMLKQLFLKELYVKLHYKYSHTFISCWKTLNFTSKIYHKSSPTLLTNYVPLGNRNCMENYFISKLMYTFLVGHLWEKKKSECFWSCCSWTDQNICFHRGHRQAALLLLE